MPLRNLRNRLLVPVNRVVLGIYIGWVHHLVLLRALLRVLLLRLLLLPHCWCLQPLPLRQVLLLPSLRSLCTCMPMPVKIIPIAIYTALGLNLLPLQVLLLRLLLPSLSNLSTRMPAPVNTVLVYLYTVLARLLVLLRMLLLFMRLTIWSLYRYLCTAASRISSMPMPQHPTDPLFDISWKIFPDYSNQRLWIYPQYSRYAT